MSPEFRRVLAEAKRWGVRVQLIRPKKVKEKKGGVYNRVPGDFTRYENVTGIDHDAPVANAGIKWSTTRTKRVVKWRDDKTPYMANQLLHELVHCVLREDPNKTEEVTGPLLGLEIEAAKRLKLTGRRNYMADWGVSGTLPNLEADAWGQLTTVQKRQLIRNSQREATRQGLMKAGKPVYPRKKS